MRGDHFVPHRKAENGQQQTLTEAYQAAHDENPRLAINTISGEPHKVKKSCDCPVQTNLSEKLRQKCLYSTLPLCKLKLT